MLDGVPQKLSDFKMMDATDFFFCLQFSKAAEFSCFFFPSDGLRRSFRMNLSANQCQNCGNCNAAERMAGSLPASSATSLYRENAAAACDGALNVVGGEITQLPGILPQL